jgi:hypothetical protein
VRRPLARNEDLCARAALEHLEHRTIFILEKTPRNVDNVVGCYPNQVLVECPVMNAAEAQTIADGCLTMLSVRKDVGCIEKPNLLQTADRTLISIRGKYAASKARLMHTDSHLSRGERTLDRVSWQDRFPLLEVPDHLTLRDQHPSSAGVVSHDEAGIERAIPAGARTNEIDDWDM